MIGKALTACATNLDGKQLEPAYYRRRRRAFYGALKFAVREKQLSANSLDDVREADWKAAEVAHAVDRRRVPNPGQVAVLLDTIRSVGKTQGPRLVAAFGCMYYGMMRPSEAINLRKDNCVRLPETGWGLLELDEKCPLQTGSLPGTRSNLAPPVREAPAVLDRRQSITASGQLLPPGPGERHAHHRGEHWARRWLPSPRRTRLPADAGARGGRDQDADSRRSPRAGLEPGTPVAELHRVSFSGDKPIEVLQGILAGDRYVFCYDMPVND